MRMAGATTLTRTAGLLALAVAVAPGLPAGAAGLDRRIRESRRGSLAAYTASPEPAREDADLRDDPSPVTSDGRRAKGAPERRLRDNRVRA